MVLIISDRQMFRGSFCNSVRAGNRYHSLQLIIERLKHSTFALKFSSFRFFFSRRKKGFQSRDQPETDRKWKWNAPDENER